MSQRTPAEHPMVIGGNWTTEEHIRRQAMITKERSVGGVNGMAQVILYLLDMIDAYRQALEAQERESNDH